MTNDLVMGSNYTITIFQLRDADFDFGLDNYEIFDEKYREILNNNILNHYNLYEIGFETEVLFKMQLVSKMKLIMPYYNKKYVAQLPPDYIMPEDTSTFNEKEVYEGLSSSSQIGNSSQDYDSKQNDEQSSKRNSDGFSIESNTPQNELITNNIRENAYASSANKNELNDTTNSKNENIQSSNSKSNNKIDNEGNLDYNKSISKVNSYKYNSNAYDNLNKYYISLVNIDYEIINDLADLFITIL